MTGWLMALLSIMPLGAAPEHGMALHGQPKYAADFQHFTYVNPNAPKGGQVRVSGFGTFDTVNPFTLKGIAAKYSRELLYDTLMVSAADEAASMYGLIAERVQRDTDGLWVRFFLRPEARFNDGSPITAADVVYSFNTLLAHGHPSFKQVLSGVKEVVADGPYKVTFHFHNRDNRELPLRVASLPIFSQAAGQQQDFASTSFTPPLSSGPYQIAELDPGRSIRYQRRDDYWAAQLPVRRGHFNFAEIKVLYYRDRTITLEAFKGYAFDIHEENTAKNWANAYDIPAVNKGWIKRQFIPHQIPTGMQAFYFNTRRSVFDDVRVRQAIALMFDFEWSNAQLFNSAYSRNDSYFDNSELASRGVPSEAERALLEPWRQQLPQALLQQPFVVPQTDGSGQLRDLQRQARDLLVEAGWQIKDWRRYHPQRQQALSFEILLAQPGFQRICLPFIKNLQRLGIEAKLRVVDPAQYINRLRDFDYDMIVGWLGNAVRSPGNEQQQYWGSQAAQTPGSSNYAGVSDPVVDGLLQRLLEADDREQLITATRALDRVLLWQHYVIPQWHLAGDRYVWWDKFSRPQPDPKYGVNLHTWWYDRHKAEALQQARGETP